MSKYNETIKSILTEVEKFLVEGIKSVTLPKPAARQKQLILDKIDAFREEYPNALPAKTVFSNDDDSGTTGSSLEDPHDGEESAYGENIPALPAKEAAIGSTRNGMLSKRRKTGDLMSKLNPYQKRWCIVKQNIFYYYEKPSDKQQKGAFSLTGYTFREAPFLEKEPNKKDLSFQLYRLGDRTYEFLAASKQDMEEWKEVIGKAASEKPADSPGSQPTQFEDDGEIYEPIDEQIDAVPQPPADDLYDDGGEASFRPGSIYDDATCQVASTPIKQEPPFKERRPPPPEPKRVVPDSKNWKLGVENDYENMYYGKWDCTADARNELAFKQGDIVHVLSKEFDTENWWIAELEGKIGLVPKQYLTEAYERVIG